MRRTPDGLARRAGELWRRLRNLARTVVLRATEGTAWDVRFATDETGAEFTDEVEAYQQVGYAARPPLGQGDGVVVTVHASANHPVLIATRDDKTRNAVVELASLEPDETLVFNSGVMLKLTAAGEVLIGTPDGTFEAVALASHTHDVPEITGQASYVPGFPKGPATSASSANSTRVKVE